MRYVVIGDVGVDTILTLDEQNPELCSLHGDELWLAAGHKLPATASHQSIGGNAANVAIALSRLSAEVKIVTHLGKDWAAETIKRILQDEGLKLETTGQSAGGTNHSTILLFEGERTIISYHAVGDYPPERPRHDDWLILCSMGANGGSALERALKLDLPLVYLPGTKQVYGSRRLNARILKRAELVVVNEDEARAMLDVPAHDPVILARRLLDTGVREAVITSGIQGAVVAHASGIWHGGVWHGVPRRDPTGAGDAFAATFLWSRLSGSSLNEALKVAAINAGSVVAEFGSTTGLLKRTTLARLAKTETVTVRQEKNEPRE